MILSVSRRTDIPSYYSDWFINRICEGFVLTRNPMNQAQLSRIDLSKDLIDCIVFWTKDPYPMLDKLPVLDLMGYNYLFQFTLTPYGKDIEKNLRDKKDIILTFQKLSDMIGKDRALWRYDPIILNNKLTIEYHIKHFEELCMRLCGYTDRCTISFVDLYTKINKPVKDGLIREITGEESKTLAKCFSEIAGKYNIKLYACCEKLDLSEYGVNPGSCIDKSVIEKICGYSLDVKKDANQRPGCGCIQSIDIGVYNTCKNGCIYCYANYSMTSVEKNYRNYNPKSGLLSGTVREDEKINERKIWSFKRA